MEQLVKDDVIDCFFEIQNGEIVEVNTLNKAEKRPSTDQKDLWMIANKGIYNGTRRTSLWSISCLW